ncbi:IPT/TIG domain-containing protein [Nocardia abscessus]|uniref:IPT/TIG domain-containing protein n=1 Tax=Nocardia abscessus TaxID=120957 RepID=UPI001892DC4F|nr:IPT/TIG domain-containing protein [Nocardia abscessus]MBF6340968.1 IPT/TIG domain-containing protein [Nocardia abscessus]
MPTITSVSPTTGPTSGGNSVVITGTGFTGPTTVRFGGTATTFTLDSATQITAIAPPGTGAVDITVANAGGTSNGFPYTYVVAVPVIASIFPNSGPATGGTLVVLVGTGFSGATAVNFGATPATFFIGVSSTLIIAIAPPGTGTVPVTVTTPAGTSPGVPFTYVSVPALVSATPNTGPVTGGTVVTITGSGFTGATGVFFGVLPAVSFTVNSDTQITAVTPVGLGPVPITVTAPGGIATGVFFTYA